MKAAKAGDVVEIDWVDAASTRGWGGEDRAHGTHKGLVSCSTVGYLLGHDKTAVRVCQSRNTDTGDVTEIMSIPRSCVRRIRKCR